MNRMDTESPNFWVDTASEQRRHPRKLSTRLLLTAPVSGRILDINATGIGIETRESLAVLTRKNFAFGADAAGMKFFGEIRWCRLTDTIPLRGGNASPVYRAGIAFVEQQHSD